MSKYTRHHPSIIRESDSSDYWMDQLGKNLERSAVEPRNQQSVYDQINSIMSNKKSKFSSVEDAVQDMRERSGLTAYLEKVKKAAASYAAKVAQNNAEPIIFTSVPSVKVTLDNFIRETRGNATVPAILEKIKEIHRTDVTDPKKWEDDNLVRYISDLNYKEKQKYPKNDAEYAELGRSPRGQDNDIDSENTDAWHSLMPASK
jgi:hypothetical protein